MCRSTVFSDKMNSLLKRIRCPEGLVSFHHPYCTICRNRIRTFKLHGMNGSRYKISSKNYVAH